MTVVRAPLVDAAAGTASLRTLGTGAQQAAAGNDSRIAGAAQKASNLSDLASAAAARTNLGLGGAAVLAVGTTAGTVAAGDDPRFGTGGSTVYNVKAVAYGAKGDGGQTRTAAMTSGSAVLTRSANHYDVPFSAAMVGQNIKVSGAGAGGSILTTTVLSYQSATQVTLSANAGATVSRAGNGTGGLAAWWSQDDSTAIAAAITACKNAGGGIVYFPAGYYAASNLTVYSNIQYVGEGVGATIIMQVPGSTTNLFLGDQYAAWEMVTTLTAADPEGLINWSFQNLTLEGNREVCPAGGDNLKVYTAVHYLANIHSRGAFGYGIKTVGGDANSTQPLVERSGGGQSKWSNVAIYWCTAGGWYVGGPHDLLCEGLDVHFCSNHGLNFQTPSGTQLNGGGRLTHFHIYGNGGATFNDGHNVNYAVGTGWEFASGVIEGSNGAQFNAVHHAMLDGVEMYPAGSTTGKGLVLAGGVSYVEARGLKLGHASDQFTAGALDVTNSGGYCDIDAVIGSTSGNRIIGLTFTTSQKADRYHVNVLGGGGGSIHYEPPVGAGGTWHYAQPWKDLAYSASITPVNYAPVQDIVATNATAFAINAITGALNGDEVTFVVINASGGAMGTITWDATYKMAGSFTNPATGKRRLITFLYDGTNWYEKTRTAADI